MTRKILWLLLAMFISVGAGRSSSETLLEAQASSAERMRFHCEDDTLKIEALLAEGRDSGLSDANELVCFYAHRLEGTPYVGHTLEGDVEILQSGIEPGHSLQVAGTVEELVYLILMHDVLEPSRGKARYVLGFAAHLRFQDVVNVDSFLYILSHFQTPLSEQSYKILSAKPQK